MAKTKNGSARCLEGLTQPPAPASQPTEEIRPGGAKVEVWNDHVFKKLRQMHGIEDDFLNKGWSSLDFQNSPAKGGGALAFCGDKYVVKLINTGDHDSLLAHSENYLKHMQAGRSLLAPIYLHYRDVETDKKYIAMGVVGSGPTLAKEMYDLKGCADDKTLVKNYKKVKAVHKRIWKVFMWGGTCCWTEDRFKYYEGKVAARSIKFNIGESQHSQVVQLLQRDVEWLKQADIMDYSLLVVEKDANRDQISPWECRLVKQSESGSTTLSIGIIDYLQRWNTAKVVANCIKVAERNKATVKPDFYGERFLAHFSRVFGSKQNSGYWL